MSNSASSEPSRCICNSALGRFAMKAGIVAVDMPALGSRFAGVGLFSSDQFLVNSFASAQFLGGCARHISSDGRRGFRRSSKLGQVFQCVERDLAPSNKVGTRLAENVFRNRGHLLFTLR